MATPVAPGGPTLEQVLGRTSAAGMKRFPDSTQMGLWVFASHLAGALPYRQLVSMGPLPGQFGVVTRRQAIQRLAATGQTVPHAPAALYGTLLAAYKQMVAGYQPQYVNDIIVLTAGVENDPSDISAATLLHDLHTLVEPPPPGGDPDGRLRRAEGSWRPAADRQGNQRQGLARHQRGPDTADLLPGLRAAHLPAALPQVTGPAPGPGQARWTGRGWARGTPEKISAKLRHRV